MGCSFCKGQLLGPCHACGAGRPWRATKDCQVCGEPVHAVDVCLKCVVARRQEATALRDEASIWLGSETQPEPRTDPIAADVRPAVGPTLAPVRDVRGHSDAEAAACVVGYNRALADSLKSAQQILDELSKEHWPLVALVAHLKERLAEDSGRLGWSFSGDDLLREVGRVGVEAGVRVRSNGEG